MPTHRSSSLSLALAVALMPLPLAAQSRTPADRYELGLRLGTFERALDAVTDEARRRRAFVELEVAVQAFFSMNLDGLAQGVNAATFALRATPPSEAEHYAARLWLHLPQRLVDVEERSMACELRALPTPRGEEDLAAPKDAVFVVRLAGTGTDLLRAPIGELPQRFSLQLPDAEEGDFALQWSVQCGDTTVLQREQGLSLVARRDARLQALTAKDDANEDRDDLEGLTLQSLVRLLRGMTKERREEAVLPGARLLREAEAIAALDREQHYYSGATEGQFWLRVKTAAGSEHVRLCVPAASNDATKVPLVLALHGAGGSENLFCDGYGNGAVVRLCQERGWFLCAPRSSGLTGVDLPALVDALAERFPIDRTKVLLIGHSMGAMQSIAQSMRAPSRFRAVAALGGGGSVRKNADLRDLPFFVAAGERDFGRGGALSLSQQLQKAGCTTTWREYPDVEHFAIVQVALPDVFAFFDRALEAARAR